MSSPRVKRPSASARRAGAGPAPGVQEPEPRLAEAVALSAEEFEPAPSELSERALSVAALGPTPTEDDESEIWSVEAAPPVPAVEVATDDDADFLARAPAADGVEPIAAPASSRERRAGTETRRAARLSSGFPDEDEGEADEPEPAIDYAAAPSRFAHDDAGEVEPPEARIDRLLSEAARAFDDPVARARMAEAFSEIAHHLGGSEALPGTEPPRFLAGARELLSPDYYMRQWGRLAMRNRSEDVDEFGLDRAYEQRMRPLLEGLYRRWFRTETHGIELVPSAGRAMLVGNHAGALPWDGLMLQTAVRLEHRSRREVRWLAEDFVAHAPFLGAITNRLGAVRACPENAERLLAAEKLVAVFPEGAKGLGKPWSRRYEIQRFGRGGFVKIAIRMRAPIVPVAIVGSEETHPTIVRVDGLGRFFGLPFLPITPTFPWLGPLGLVPLPSRWAIRFGKPIDLSDEPVASANDPVRVQFLAEEVRSAVQALVKRALEDRPRAF